MKVVSCAAPYGVGGLGQHLAHVVEEARATGLLGRYYSPAPKDGDTAGETVALSDSLLLRVTPIRFRPDLRNYISGMSFDRAVSRRLASPKMVTGFSCQALTTLRRAHDLGSELLELESPTTHLRHVIRQQRRAERLGIERGWATEHHLKRALQEYDAAHTIYVTSRLAHESLVAEGISSTKLKVRRLTVHPRFVPAKQRSRDDIFRVVYVGALTAAKGVPILMDAFGRLTQKSQLTLIGGWATRGMRKYLMQKMAEDPRITSVVADPLPFFQEADAYVHPSFHDGFGYGPMEAMACDVPVIVTEDTGMKEHVKEGVNGYVVATGSWQPILERLQHLASR